MAATNLATVTEKNGFLLSSRDKRSPENGVSNESNKRFNKTVSCSDIKRAKAHKGDPTACCWP